MYLKGMLNQNHWFNLSKLLLMPHIRTEFALLKKFTSKVDGFTFGTNRLMVITSEVKVFMTFWFYYIRRYYLLREVA